MARWHFASAMLIAMSAPVHAAPNNGDLFDLCPPNERMHLTVEYLPEDATQGELTREQVWNVAESRLRAAGIYDSSADPYLAITVTVGPPTGSAHCPFYAVIVEYNRFLLDHRILWLRGVRTWWAGSIGQGSRGSILSNLSQHLDRFLVEYLRVRDSKACQDLRAKDGG